MHEWYQGQCKHDVLTEPPTLHGVEISYFMRGNPDFRLLQKILTDKRWMISLKYFTRFRLDFGLWIVMHDQPPLSYTKPVTVCIAVTLPIDTLECWKTFTIPYLHIVPKGMHLGK